MNTPSEPLSPILPWGLAVSRRLMLLMKEGADVGDQEAMWLCQWGAYALHNLLLSLADHSDDEAYLRRASEMLLRLPDLIRTWGAPDRLVSLADSLIGDTDVRAILDLDGDAEVSIPPQPELRRGLYLLYEVCLDTRQTWPVEALCEGEAYWEACRRHGLGNARLAAILKDLPLALVHWPGLDLDHLEHTYWSSR